MNKHVKIVCALLALVFTMSVALIGCGNNDAALPTTANERMVNGVDVSKEVQLVMYLVFDAQPDAGKVYDEVNKKLKEDINTTVTVKYLSSVDWDQKYPLVLASGEDLDCIYTADWAHYADQSTKNAFMEIKADDVKKIMPEYYAKVPAAFWDQVKINGKGYMIPYLNQQIEGQTLVMTRGDLRTKYNLPEMKSTDDLVNYLTTVVKNEKGMIGYDGSAPGVAGVMNYVFYKQPNGLFIHHILPLFSSKLDDMSATVNYVLDDPAYLDMLNTAKKLSDAGVWTKGVLASKNDNLASFNAGKSIMRESNGEGMVQEANIVYTNNPTWKPESNDLSPDKLHESSSGTRSGLAISANSKNYQRVMLMQNLFGTHKDYYDLTTYGIEGVHYTPIGDNKMKVTELGTKNYAPKANCPWAWERIDFMRYPDNVPDSIINTESNWIKAGLASKTPIVSFNFVDTNVKNEVAACNNIYQTKGYILLAGLSANIEADLQKYKDDLKKAGIETIQTELQKQVTAYINSLK